MVVEVIILLVQAAHTLHIPDIVVDQQVVAATKMQTQDQVVVVVAQVL
jgi:hypothetical protein